MHITGLYIYPVKSCAGIAVKEMMLAATGPLYDRMFVIVNAEGEALTQREHPRLCLVRTLITRGHLAIRIPGGPLFITPLEQDGIADRDVTIWGDTCRGMDEGDVVASMLSDFLGEPCRLVRQLSTHPRIRESTYLGMKISVSFSDGYPLLVVSDASRDDLNQRLEEPVPMDRFRANVIIGGSPAYAEDTWEWLAADRVVLSAANTCTRCATTLVDQRTSMMSKEPLRTLATYRPKHEGKPTFGRNFRHVNSGIIRVGDIVTAA